MGRLWYAEPEERVSGRKGGQELGTQQAISQGHVTKEWWRQKNLRGRRDLLKLGCEGYRKPLEREMTWSDLILLWMGRGSRWKQRKLKILSWELGQKMMVTWKREETEKRDLKYILKAEVTRLNERRKSLVRKRSGFGTLIHVPLRKVGKTRFGMMEKKRFFFLCQVWDV